MVFKREYLRHSSFQRTRHSKIFLDWLDTQAERLAMSAEAVFALLKAGGTTDTVEAMATVVIPANTAVPTLSGADTHVGTVLTATPGTWSGSPTPSLSYQWQYSDSTNIAGATALTYTLAEADVGKSIKFVVAATNTGGQAVSSTQVVGPVTEKPASGTTSGSSGGS